MLDLAPSPPDALPGLRRPTPRALFHLAGQLARQADIWRPHVQFAHDTRYSVRVAVTEAYEAWLLTWLPGQSTGLHDHGGSAGAFVVVEGEVDEATLAPARGHAPAALVHRTLAAGRVRAFGEGYVHDVINTGRRPAVSLHVYAPALDTMRRFVLDDIGLPRLVSVEREGVDW